MIKGKQPSGRIFPSEHRDDRSQVLTNADGEPRRQSAEVRASAPVENHLRELGPSSLVIAESSPEQSSPPHYGGKDDSSSGRVQKKRRGVWPSSPRLNWRRDVRVIDDVAHDLASLGYGFTHMVTITPLSGSPLTRKRVISRAVAHLGQALKRRGHEHVGLTIIEHPIN